MTLLLMVALPFLGALLPVFAERGGRSLCAGSAALAPLLGLYLLLTQWGLVFEGEPIREHWSFLPELGLDIALRLDGLAFLFALLILGIGLLVILYARYYLSKRDPRGRFFAYLLLFMGAMLGVVTSDNLLLMLVFWELTSISSFLLIGYWGHRSDARKGARMALTVTAAGGVALLAGILMIGNLVGSFALDDVLASGDLIRDSEHYPVILTLVLIGVFTKSAQFPFHFWLPHAMAAPTPVSAYLHSATMVKAGVFLLARLYPALSGTDLWFVLVSGAGMVTLLLGAVTALFKHDLKGLLAFSTISHLGLITLLFGMNSQLAAVAAVFHIINHATFKASLFMAAGIIDHETGTRDMRSINGLWRYMPYTGGLAMVAAAAMAGVPLLNGFLSKEMFFTEALEVEQMGLWSWAIPMVALLAGVFSVAYSLRFIHDVFFNGKPINLPKYPPHEPPRYMKVPVEILVGLCLLVGMLPAFTVEKLLAAAASATLNGALPDYSLSIWHGVNLPLIMSIVALVGGVLVYSQRLKVFALRERLPEFDTKIVFDVLVIGLTRLSTSITNHLENGSLQRYVAFLLGSVLVLAITALMGMKRWTGAESGEPADLLSWLFLGILVVATLATVVWHRQRLLSLLMMSVVGLIVSLAFARFSAPDLALTQLTVEFVSVVLLMLALHFLPQQTPPDQNRERVVKNVLLASAVGGGMALFTWMLLTRPVDTISGYFMRESVPGGGGDNVVNVILVDFRGFDTFGEITVLALAALGIFAMFKGLRLRAAPTDDAGHLWAADRHPLILEQLSRPLLTIALLVAIYIFLRGHNLPGGGFIAGLVASVILILQFVASDSVWVTQRLPQQYTRLISVGLLVAGLTGLASWFWGYPFLTSAHGYVAIPLVGKTHLASAILFDIGVFLTVVGATLLILVQLGNLTSKDAHVRESSL